MEQSETCISKKHSYDVITSHQIQIHLDSIRKNTGLDVSDIPISTTRPGDNTFDWQEIKFKFSMGADRKDFIALAIEEYDKHPDQEHMEKLRKAASDGGIQLEGKLPGFARTEDDGRVIFFSVHEDDIIPMAQKYVKKEGETVPVSSKEEALKYLESLAEIAVYHEVGHTVYGRHLNAEKVEHWTKFLAQNLDIIYQVAALQRDKYSSINKIPIPVEAFADFFVDVAAKGSLISRLSKRIPQSMATQAHERVKNILMVG